MFPGIYANFTVFFRAIELVPKLKENCILPRCKNHTWFTKKNKTKLELKFLKTCIRIQPAAIQNVENQYEKRKKEKTCFTFIFFFKDSWMFSFGLEEVIAKKIKIIANKGTEQSYFCCTGWKNTKSDLAKWQIWTFMLASNTSRATDSIGETKTKVWKQSV